MGEAAIGVADLPVRHYYAGFRFAGDSVDDVAGAERHVDIGHIVLMEKCGIVRGNAHAEYADVGVFQYQMMMRLFRNGNSDRSLGAQRKCEKKQERTKKRPHL